MAYVVDTYNRYDRFDREHSLYVVRVGEQEYAIKEVELEWGVPVLPTRIGEDREGWQYALYATYEDAKKFLSQIKALNR